MAACRPGTNIVLFPELRLEQVAANPSLCAVTIEADIQLSLERVNCLLTADPGDVVDIEILVMGEYPLGGI